MRARALTVVATLAVLVAACAPQPAAAPRPRTAGGLAGNPTLARDLFDRLNAERAARGLPPLVWDASLASVAEDWSSSMATSNTLQHSDLAAALAERSFVGYNALGENILSGAATNPGGSLDNSWMNSDGHRNTMLSPGFSAVGIGVVCANGRVWATQTFGRLRNETGALQPPTPVTPIVAATGGPTCTSASPVVPPPTTTPTTPPSAPPSAAASGIYLPPAAGGLVGGTGFSEGSSILWDSGADLAKRLDGIAATGARWLRVDVRWPDLEPTHGTYSWGSADRVVDAAQARGLSVLGTIDYTPAWARPGGTTEKTPPTNPADYANFADAAARHFAGKIQAYEIWNEENSSAFWATGANPAAYVALLKPAYTAIKAANPAATVLTGGTAPTATSGSEMAPADFLTGIYAAGGKGFFDAVANHGYHWPYLPLDPEPNYNWNSFGGVTPKLHDIMVVNGDGAKRIWMTESGAPTPTTKQGVTTTPAYLANYVTQAVAAMRSWPWSGPYFYYSYRDRGTDITNPEDNFGLVTHDFSPKGSAVTAFVSATAG